MIHSQRTSTFFHILLPAALAVALSLPVTAQITNGVKLFKGVISDATSGTPVEGGRVWVYQGKNPEPVTNSKINPGTGRYQVLLNPSTEYRFQFKSPKYYITEASVTTPSESEYEEVIRDFSIKAIPIGSTIFSGRLFAPGTTEMKPIPAFQTIIDLMKHEKGINVAIAVTPDALAPEVKPAPAAKATKKPKKGKKGAAAPDVEVATTPAPQAMSETDLKTLGQQQAIAIKDFFKAQGISITRIDWDVKPGAILASGATYPDNVIVTIKRIEVEDDE